MFACLTLISTGLGGLAAIRLRDRLHLLLGFSSGAVLGVALFDILPEIFAMDGGASYMPVVALGFLAFFGLERYTAMHRAREHAHAMAAHEQELGSWNAGGLALHSFLDGVAIGVGFQASFGVGLLIAMGVIAHDLSDGLNTVTVVLAHGNPLRRAVYWLGIDMLTPAVVQSSSGVVALAAGVFCRFVSLHRRLGPAAGSARARFAVGRRRDGGGDAGDFSGHPLAAWIASDDGLQVSLNQFRSG
jgi:ZIP family zinc transporter